jgi:hypothetical protein
MTSKRHPVMAPLRKAAPYGRLVMLHELQSSREGIC